METSELKHSTARIPESIDTTSIEKCLLCHLPQSDEALEGMIRFVTYPPNHVNDAGAQVLCANTIAPLIISASNMTDYEIINKKDLKNKYGNGSDVMYALSRCRSLFSRVGTEWNESNREEEDYFLVKEFERHLKMIQDLNVHADSPDSTCASKQRVVQSSKTSPRSESNEQPHEQNVKKNSDSENSVLQNIFDRIPSPETSFIRIPPPDNVLQEQQHQISKEVNLPLQGSGQQQRWDHRYKQLVCFEKEFGHTRVPLKFPPNPSLHKWVDKQRSYYRMFQKGDSSSKIKNYIEILDKFGFEWNPRVNSWDNSYKELVSFVKKFGHTRIPRKAKLYKTLAKWANKQRQCYKDFQNGDLSSKMTENRIELLNKVDFEWETKSKFSQNAWNQRYEELSNHVEKYGNGRVPRDFPQNPRLGKWMDKQRRYYKKFKDGDLSSNITEYRIERLNKVGCEWKSASYENQWKERYKELVTFVEKCGHTRVSSDFPENPSLGNWAYRQRLEYKQLQKGDLSSKMTSDRIESLEKIGFEWDFVPGPRRKICATL